MFHSSKPEESLESLGKEIRRMRLVFGVTLIILSLIFTVTLPSVIRNAVFRVGNQPETKGLLTEVVEIIRGEPVTMYDAVPDVSMEEEALPAEASE